MRYLFVFFCLSIVCCAASDRARAEDSSARSDAIVVRTLERISDFDLESNPAVRDAVLRHIDRSEGTPEYMGLIKRFQPAGIESKLMVALLGKDRSAAVESAEMLIEMDQGRRLVKESLQGEKAIPVTEILGFLGNGRANHFLAELSSDENVAYAQRRAAVSGLTRTKPGQQRLIQLAKDKKLVGDTFLIAGALLARSENEAIRNQASAVLPQPSQKDAKPLPPVDQLAKQEGDVANGLKLFRGVGTCANCHIVNEYGKDVGPNLSEIGSKLSKEAMLTAILAPSAGISHNYENYSVLNIEGQVITGLKVSETDDEVVIRTVDAIDRKILRDDIEQIKKSEKSIMPENLHHLSGQQGLIDIVEYMMTLKKKS